MPSSQFYCKPETSMKKSFLIKKKDIYLILSSISRYLSTGEFWLSFPTYTGNKSIFYVYM